MSCQQFTLSQNMSDLTLRPRTRLLWIGDSSSSQTGVTASHTHPCTELLFVTGGSCRLRICQEDHILSEGNLAVICPAIPHAIFAPPEQCARFVALGVEELELSGASDGWVQMSLSPDWGVLRTFLRLMAEEAVSAQPESSLICQNLLEVILIRLRRRESLLAPDPGPIPEPRISRECALVRRYIDAHFREALTLDQLASHVHVNKYYLAHAFRSEFGTSPISYLIHRRIQESCLLLRETDLTLSGIAQALGFSSQSYFSQCFRRVQGISPLEYRRRCREKCP